jgi:osmoprotectant transport system substrate-binding protein
MTSDEDKSLMTSPAKKRRVMMALLLGAVGVTALPFARTSLAAKPAAKATINVGVKNFAEEQILADMYQLLLQKAGFKVTQHVLGETPALQAALLRGDIDMYPEYTGTGLGVLNAKATVVTNAKQAYSIVKKEYQKRFHITWLKQTPMNDTNGVGVTQATSAKYKLHTLSDLAKSASKLTFAADPGCKDRPDCLAGFKRYYKINFKSISYIGSTPLRYTGLKNSQFDAVEVFTTDAPIQANHVVVLTDNKHAVFPADHVAPIVRDSVLKKYPKIKPALNALAHYITTPVMIGLNGKVILQSKDAMTVARTFLRSKHLI